MTIQTNQSWGSKINVPEGMRFFSKVAKELPADQSQDPQLAQRLDPNEISPLAMHAFAKKHNLHRSQFETDELAMKQLNPQRKRILGHVETTERLLREATPNNPYLDLKLSRSREKHDEYLRGLVAGRSLQNTMIAANRDPQGFEDRLEQSRKAEQNLSLVHHDRSGALLGGLSGAVGGGILGARHAGRNQLGKGAVGLVGGLLGAGAGAATGYGAGRVANQVQTGSRYSQIREPYEVAYSL